MTPFEKLADAFTRHQQRRHVGEFADCKMLPCTLWPHAERIQHVAQTNWTAARNMQTSEGVPEFDLSTSEGRGALLLYVDKLHRKVAELAGQSHDTAAHQGEHCANIAKIVDKVNSIRAFTIATAKATEVGLANVDRFEQELVDRVNEMWSEVVPLIEAHRAGRVEAWANTPFGRGDHPLTFDSSGQLAEAVYARLRTADAWAAEPESDTDDVKWWFAEHHRDTAAVLATMYAAVTANEPVTETVEQHGVSPYSPSDHQGVKNAWGQHPGHPILAEERYVVADSGTDIVSTGDHLDQADEPSAWTTGNADPSTKGDPADGLTWKPTGDRASDIEAAWKIHEGWDQATTGYPAHGLLFEVCGLSPCVKFAVAARQTFDESRDDRG